MKMKTCSVILLFIVSIFGIMIPARRGNIINCSASAQIQEQTPIKSSDSRDNLDNIIGKAVSYNNGDYEKIRTLSGD
jgi:hypothetical protein